MSFKVIILGFKCDIILTTIKAVDENPNYCYPQIGWILWLKICARSNEKFIKIYPLGIANAAWLPPGRISCYHSPSPSADTLSAYALHDEASPGTSKDIIESTGQRLQIRSRVTVPQIPNRPRTCHIWVRHQTTTLALYSRTNVARKYMPDLGEMGVFLFYGRSILRRGLRMVAMEGVAAASTSRRLKTWPACINWLAEGLSEPSEGKMAGEKVKEASEEKMLWSRSPLEQ